jgi:amidase
VKYAVRAAILLSVVALTAQTAPPRSARFTVVETSIADMQRAMQEHRVTSRDIVTEYLTRIALYNGRIHAAIAVNPRALAEADARDAERAQGRVRGPLHGIPIALKDNIHTTDMPTTGGALAFATFVPPYDATLTKNLRDAGAIIIAKTVLTELANWVAGAPTPMPGNYSAVGGFAFNPYDPRPDPRDSNNDGRPVLSTGGSSSGAGTAANLWAANAGSDTSGSIVNPAQLTMLVGIRPTTGRISRHGIIPITLDQDTSGPMAKSVADAAILLGALESASPDPDDAATTRCAPPAGRDYTKFLNRTGLKGARIGIPRAFYYDRRRPADRKSRARRPEWRAGGVDGGGDRRHQARRRDRRRPGEPAERARPESRQERAAVRHVLGYQQREGQGRELLVGPQIRHEARLQRVPRVAWDVSAGEVFDRAADIQPHPPARERDSLRAVEPRYFR